jgi:ParB-like chromosome segregation protein Spo0J
MSKLKIETKTVKLSEIRANPDNPRTITETDMEYLIKSLREFPEMMELREIVVDETMMILGGNMRFKALEQIGEKKCIAKIVYGLTDEQKREFIIKDNGKFGSYDMDLLANGWDDLPLVEWGVDIPRAWGDEPSNDDPDPDDVEPQIINCPKCGHEFSILKKAD